MTDTLYVAGGMTGLPDWNFHQFFAVAGALRAFGYNVENPAENDGDTLGEAIENANESKHEYSYYMRKDITRLAKCDGIVMLPGWRDSRGANLEYTIARDLEIPAYTFQDFRLQPLFTVIGLSGYAGSGKDTAAQEFVRHGFERLAFADILREALYALNPVAKITEGGRILTVRDLVDDVGWDAAKRDSDSDVRVLLQRLGTEAGRELIGENVWVDVVFRKMQDGGKYVITDTRFPNEAKAIEKVGGEVWRITRKGVGPANDHTSERALETYDFDRNIYNDGSVDDLHHNIGWHLNYMGLTAA